LLGLALLVLLISVGAGVYFYYHKVKPKVAQIENSVRTFPMPATTPPAPAQPAAPGGGAPGPGGAPGSTPQNPAVNSADLEALLKQFGKMAPPNSAAAKLIAGLTRPDPSFPPLKPGDPSHYTGPIVLQPGMTITLSMSEPLVGDYDVLISLKSVNNEGATMNFSTQTPSNPGATSPANASVLKVHMLHTDTQEDMLHATSVMTIFSEKFPALIPGSTILGLSQDAFARIKSGSGADMTYVQTSTPASMTASPNQFWSTLKTYNCHETRAEPNDAAFPVLVNGWRVTLASIKTTCPNRATGHSIAYVFDDPKLPLFLAAWNGQLTEINFPASAAGAGGQSIEQALKEEGHVDVYGIYFDFASDKLRPESAPVLQEIAKTLTDNPTWKLHVNGHTDNIGGDAYNLDLSNRRAAAVKQALVTQYHIDPARLDPQGFGATQPKESNDTLEGRARNRRVELIRE
jgi:outer membrane protein OmpA-like peptidoglycan-associated protein